MKTASLHVATTIDGQVIYGARERQVLSMHGHVKEFFTKEVALTPGMTVFDVGANIGMFSWELLTRLSGQATVHCFEPAPQNFAMLKGNLEGRFPAAEVHLHQCAVSATASETKFYFRPNSPATSSIEKAPIQVGVDQMICIMGRDDLPDYYKRSIPRWFPQLPRFLQRFLIRGILSRAAKAVEVPCATRRLSDVIREFSVQTVDLLKIDVEGHEWDVFQGIDDEDWPRIRMVTCEVNDVDGRLSRIRELLTRHGFQNITVEQEIRFQGTRMYDLFAAR